MHQYKQKTNLIYKISLFIINFENEILKQSRCSYPFPEIWSLCCVYLNLICILQCLRNVCKTNQFSQSCYLILISNVNKVISDVIRNHINPFFLNIEWLLKKKNTKKVFNWVEFWCFSSTYLQPVWAKFLNSRGKGKIRGILLQFMFFN